MVQADIIQDTVNDIVDRVNAVGKNQEINNLQAN